MIHTVSVNEWLNKQKYSSKAFGLCLLQVLNLGQAHGLGYKMSKKSVSVQRKLLKPSERLENYCLKQLRKSGSLEKGCNNRSLFLFSLFFLFLSVLFQCCARHICFFKTSSIVSFCLVFSISCYFIYFLISVVIIYVIIQSICEI